MDASEISTWMVRRLATELGISELEVKTDIPLMSLGVDSLKLLSIAGELSEFTNREVSADVIWDNDSIECLASHLSKMEVDQTAIQQGNRVSSEVLPPLVVVVGGLEFGQRIAGFVPSNAITVWRKLDFLYKHMLQKHHNYLRSKLLVQHRHHLLLLSLNQFQNLCNQKLL